MRDGETMAIRGSTGAPYELSRRDDVYACTCPSWRSQRLPPTHRTRKHLRAQLGDDHEDARVGRTRVAGAHARALRTARLAPREPPELRAARDAAVRDAVARFPAVAGRMRAVYGMPLPRHLAYAVGFWHGLTPAERDEAWSYLGCGLLGVSEWFEPDATRTLLAASSAAQNELLERACPIGHALHVMLDETCFNKHAHAARAAPVRARRRRTARCRW